MTLLLQTSLLALSAWLLARAARACGIPALLGMICGGVLVAALGPQGQGEPWTLTTISSPVRLAVLALVLLRAGLGLSTEDLRHAGRLGLRLGLLPLAGDAALLTIAAMWLLDLELAAALVLDAVAAQLEGKTLRKVVYKPGRILNLIAN